MKLITTTLFAILIVSSTAFATPLLSHDDDKPIQYSELPVEAKNFITQNFAKEEVSHVTLDKEIMSDEYTVVFLSGIKLEFNGQGEWTEVDCRYTSVPGHLVPEQIANYVKNNYPNKNIIELKRKHGNYEAKITGGLELTFNSNYNLVDIDD